MRDFDVRSSARWTSTQTRRDTIPKYSNSLARAQAKSYKCNTCGKVFSNVKTMERHVSLTHTGEKPVLCPVCDKRFGSRYHMLSHYAIHRESNLAQVEPFLRRRRALSEPKSSLTSVGSIHGISRRVKAYLSEPAYKSFGTKQSYFVSEKDSSINRTQKSLRVHTSGSDHAIRGESRQTLPKIDRIPGLDAGSISTIDSVMGPTKTIVTSRNSNFLQTAEERLIQSRLRDISLAGWTVATPRGSSRPSVTWAPMPHRSITR